MKKCYNLIYYAIKYKILADFNSVSDKSKEKSDKGAMEASKRSATGVCASAE